jgi:hypothetical protein
MHAFIKYMTNIIIKKKVFNIQLIFFQMQSKNIYYFN